MTKQEEIRGKDNSLSEFIIGTVTNKGGKMGKVTMYSIHRDTKEVVTHELPWDKGSSQLERYIAKGFTFTRPGTEPTLLDDPKKEFICGECGADFDHKIALTGHTRSHKEKE